MYPYTPKGYYPYTPYPFGVQLPLYPGGVQRDFSRKGLRKDLRKVSPYPLPGEASPLRGIGVRIR